MKKVLLLNPPGDRSYIRDYYCSHISKGRYYWPPLDLLILSGILKERFEVHVLDALASGLGPEAAVNGIKKLSPDYVISTAGAASWGNDVGFLKKVSDACLPDIIVTGDYPLACPAEVLHLHQHIDAVLLDFTDSDIVRLLEDGEKSGLRNICTRSDAGEPLQLFADRHFDVPVPRHSLFPLRRYHLPHIKYHPFATIMTDFGCPFSCTFCPFERIEYKLRTMDGLARELDHLHALGIRELWLRDQSFGSSRQHALDFCDLLKTFDTPFSWSCEMRVDAADEQLLHAMKDSGCHTVMFGVETARQEVLDSHRKGITLSQVKEAFRLAKKAGLRTLAHFIFGLRGEDLKSQQDLIDLCLALDPDYASFNVAVPLWNTSFRDEEARRGNLSYNGIEIDSSDSYPIWETETLSREDIWRLRREAIRRFYFRPGFVVRSLKHVETWYQLRTLFREGRSLFFSQRLKG